MYEWKCVLEDGSKMSSHFGCFLSSHLKILQSKFLIAPLPRLHPNIFKVFSFFFWIALLINVVDFLAPFRHYHCGVIGVAKVVVG